MDRKATVLLVDDDDDIRAVVRERLEQEGYEIDEARNGLEALTYLSRPERLPCVVLLDYMMPFMNGAELLEVMGRFDRLVALPVVMLSAEHAREVPPGARYFVRKPFALDDVVGLVHGFCRAA